MVCLGLEPGVTGWKAQKNPLSYGGTICLMLKLKLNYLYNVHLRVLTNASEMRG